MKNELSCLDYYSSGFKPSSLSHSKQERIKAKSKYINKEEVTKALKGTSDYFFFFSRGGSINERIIR